MERTRPFKSKVHLKITRLKKEEDNYRVIDEFHVKVNGNDLWDSCKEKSVAIEFVNAQPREFKFGILYVLLTGDWAWIFNDEGEGDYYGT